MTAFATVAELADHLQTTIAAGQPTTAAQQALDGASAAIRTYTHQTISAVAGEVKTFTFSRSFGARRTYTDLIFLPELPVTAVASVVVDGVTLVPNVDYTWDGATGILRRLNGWWDSGAPVTTVVVTYSHGYGAVPDDVKGVCLALAGRLYQSAGVEGRIEYSVGNYAEKSDPAAVTSGLDVDEMRALDGYRVLVLA